MKSNSYDNNNDNNTVISNIYTGLLVRNRYSVIKDLFNELNRETNNEKTN